VANIHVCPALVHFAWLSLRSRPWRRTLARNRHKLLRHLEQARWPFRLASAPIMAAVDLLRPPRPHTDPRSGYRTGGFLGDNKIGPRAALLVPPSAAGQRLYLDGVAPVDTELTVKVNGRRAVHALSAGKRTRIDLGAWERGQRIDLRFSRCGYDFWGHPHGFVIEQTNLFEERDLAA
jgi:hypothetical protein